MMFELFTFFPLFKCHIKTVWSLEPKFKCNIYPTLNIRCKERTKPSIQYPNVPCTSRLPLSPSITNQHWLNLLERNQLMKFLPFSFRILKVSSQKLPPERFVSSNLIPFKFISWKLNPPAFSRKAEFELLITYFSLWQLKVNKIFIISGTNGLEAIISFNCSKHSNLVSLLNNLDRFILLDSWVSEIRDA